ncbi:MAG: hypothetical protein HY961_12525 [Ignavibacteriae bacterium]|nr:hypothetical protein [Ignavibacteriota bacterium]
MATSMDIPSDLISRITEVAKRKGILPEDFLARIVEEKLIELEEQETVFAITDKVRRSLESKGISEARTLADFAEFRHLLNRDRKEGSHHN